MSYTRSITAYEVPGAASGIRVTADERDAVNGNASHNYRCGWPETGGVIHYVYIPFQNGPVKENAINGITNEILLAMIIDRLEGFQTSPFACDENTEALASLNHALNVLQLRTRKRVARGVEGTHIK